MSPKGKIYHMIAIYIYCWNFVKFLILIGFESLFLLNLSLTSALNFNFLLLDFIYHFLKLYFFFFFFNFFNVQVYFNTLSVKNVQQKVR